MEPPEKLVGECSVGIGPKEDYIVSLDEADLDLPLRGHPGADVGPVTPQSGGCALRRSLNAALSGEHASVFYPGGDRTLLAAAGGVCW